MYIKKVKPSFFKKPNKKILDGSNLISFQEDMFNHEEYLNDSSNISGTRNLEAIREAHRDNDNS